MLRRVTPLAGMALALALSLPAAEAAAQGAPACAPMADRMPLAGRASPYDSTFIDLGSGQVKICYGRPSVLGRTLVGGTAHPYGEPWRMGANEPTVLHTNIPLQFGDLTVPPGSYSLYAIPTATRWEIVVNRSIDRWGIPISEQVRAQDLGSISVAAGSPPSQIELFTIRFDPPSQGRRPLVIEWENYRVTVPVSPAPM